MGSIRYELAALAVALGMAIPTHHADAALLLASNGSAVCRAADGVDSNFYFSNFNVKNVSGESQLISCNLPLLRESTASFLLLGTGYDLGLYFASGTSATVQVTCTATVGYGGANSAATRSVSTKALMLSSSARSGVIHFDRLELPIKEKYESLSLNCMLPPGASLGSIRQYQPELSQVGLP